MSVSQGEKSFEIKNGSVHYSWSVIDTDEKLQTQPNKVREMDYEVQINERITKPSDIIENSVRTNVNQYRWYVDEYEGALYIWWENLNEVSFAHDTENEYSNIEGCIDEFFISQFN